MVTTHPSARLHACMQDAASAATTQLGIPLIQGTMTPHALLAMALLSEEAARAEVRAPNPKP